MTSIPRPGEPVRGSHSGAPVMALFDLLGRRWAMGVLWTLCDQGPDTFRGLQQKCETISPSVLNQRLSELQAARFVRKGERGYEPTELGERVYRELVPLGETARAWARVLSDEDAPGPDR